MKECCVEAIFVNASGNLKPPTKLGCSYDGTLTVNLLKVDQNDTSVKVKGKCTDANGRKQNLDFTFSRGSDTLTVSSTVSD